MSEDEVSRSAGGTPGGEYGWEGVLALTSVSEEELAEEERAISYRRRVLRGGIDPMRAGHVRRGGVTRSPEGRGASSPEVDG